MESGQPYDMYECEIPERETFIKGRLKILAKDLVTGTIPGIILVAVTYFALPYVSDGAWNPVREQVLWLEIIAGLLIYLAMIIPALWASLSLDDVRLGKISEYQKWGFFSRDKDGPWLHYLQGPLVYRCSELEGLEFYSEWLIIKDGAAIVNPGDSRVQRDGDGNKVAYDFNEKSIYAWDGCTPKVWLLWAVLVGTPDGPSKKLKYKTTAGLSQSDEFETSRTWPITAKASLVHDAFCQYLSQVPISEKQADQIFYKMLKEEGFWFAPFYYVIVRLAAGRGARQKYVGKNTNFKCVDSLPAVEVKQNIFCAEKTKPLVIGHRGVPLVHQENTLAGFQAAVDIGIDGIELDVFKTKDNRIVVFHDEDTERLTGVKGNICDMTWSEVSKLRIKKTIDRGDGTLVDYPSEQIIPLLEDVLVRFSKDLAINIEMKAYAPNWSRRHTGSEVAKIIRHLGVEHKVICTSFDFFMLYYLEKEYPGLESGFTYDGEMLGGAREWFKKIPEINTDLAYLPGNQNDLSFLNFVMEANTIGKAIGSSVVGAQHTLIDTDTVEKFKRKNMLVGSYTLFALDTRYITDDPIDYLAEAERLNALGVDWIETDDPEQLMLIYGATKPEKERVATIDEVPVNSEPACEEASDTVIS